jgi:hypothetical protein
MDPFTIALIISAISAGAGAYSSYQGGKAQEDMAEYNAQIAENEALATQQAIEAESAKLTKAQRETKAKQRMSIQSRGGLQAGTDLLSLAEEAKEMQLDQLELRRQQDIAGVRGASRAAMSKYQGKVAGYTGKWTAGTKLLAGAGSAGLGYAKYKAEL